MAVRRRNGWMAMRATCCAALTGLVLTPSVIALPVVSPEPLPEADVAPSAVYEPAFFQQFKPLTAIQMVYEIPGFRVQSADARRGLGGATVNILINGRRVAGKANGPVQALSRMSADAVVRIEILDGAKLQALGFSGLVANVVTRPLPLSGNWSWNSQFNENQKPVFLNAGGVVNGVAGPFDYSLTFRVGEDAGGSDGPEIVRDGAGTIMETREETQQTHSDSQRVGLFLSHVALNGDVANLNLSGGLRNRQGLEVSQRILPSALTRLFRDGDDGRDGEIGVDYEFALGPGRLKIIGLSRADTSTPFSSSETYLADATQTSGDRYLRTRASGETVLRSEYAVTVGALGDMQASLEAAYNYLDVEAALTRRTATGDFEAIALPGASSRVEEVRAEAGLTISRPLDARISMQGGVAAEFSELSQSGDSGQVREFVRPKGFVSLLWQPEADLDLALRADRKVGQLDFGDFLSSVSLSDGNATEGNPEIVPDQTWEFGLEANRDLGTLGRVQMRAYWAAVQDIVDQIPVGETREAQGNLEEAERFGLQFSGTIRLDEVGVAGGRVSWGAEVSDSALNDPLTGEERALNRHRMNSYNVSFRQDAPDTPWAWGLGYSTEHRAPGYRLNQRSTSKRAPGSASFFIANKDLNGMTAQLSLSNLLNATDDYQRIVYTPRRTGPAALSEERSRQSGLEWTFSVSGSY